MKSYLRNIVSAALLSGLFVVGASAQTAPAATPDASCATGVAELDAQIRELQKKTGLDNVKLLIESSKQYLEKYGNCKNDQVVLVAYLTKNLPDWEKTYNQSAAAAELKPFLNRFDAGLKARNWDDVYAGGRVLLEKAPDTYRPAVLVLGSIGLDETAKSPRVTKWNDQTIQYAKQAIADLEANKKFESDGKPTFGYSTFTYKNREDALGWMNYTIGYILAYDKKNMKEAAPYLYKATQVNSDTKSNDVVYAALGDAALEEYNRINTEIEALKKTQLPTDTDEVKQQKIDELKAKAALSLGAAERVLDYYSRAYSLAKAKNKPNAAQLYKLVQQLYERRFENTSGLDAWIAGRAAQPVPNPTSPIQPIVDTAPAAVTTGAATTTPAVTTPAAATSAAKPAATNGTTVAAKPAATTLKPSAPAAKPVAGTKPAATRPRR